MRYPRFNNVSKSREVLSVFGGYNHTLSCKEGEFYDMQNMTSAHYPVLSPRDKRGLCWKFENPQGIMDKEGLMWIDGADLYKDGEKIVLDGVEISTDPSLCPKTMAKMGAYVIIMPDRIWYNTDEGTCGYMEKEYSSAVGAKVSFTLCEADGTAVTWHDDVYYESHDPANGDYMMQTSGGSTSLKVWSSTNSMWVTVSSTYLQVSCPGIGMDFEELDGVEITIDNSAAGWGDADRIFLNDEGDGKLSTNTYIVTKDTDYIIITGILKENKSFTNLPITVKRKVPDMAFITECNNRLWGCSMDGHEVYCCKLGDVTNWNCFMGIATDSWAATVGSDGKFTGAITYNSYPMFFKENSVVMIAISSTGAHQTKEKDWRGVQAGSERSLCILNEVLYYKSATAVCAYSGAVPQSVSDNLGEVRYTGGIAGTINDRYYLSLADEEGRRHLFVYDTKRKLWHREDDVCPACFSRMGDDLYYIDAKDHWLKSIRGTLPYQSDGAKKETAVNWMAESGTIGYESPDMKYVSRICIRLSMEFGAEVDLYIQYDSDGIWEHKGRMAGKGTRAFMVPLIPKRCDHFKYKIVGKGDCKILAISKTIEEGSDYR